MSCDRPLSPERVCSADSVQDGDSRLRASVCQKGGFRSFLRSEGRVFPDTRSSVVEEVIEVHVGGTVYQFKALCFGLSTTPQVLTRVFAAVSAWAHSHGISLLWYLDDWLVPTSLETEAKKNVQDLLLLCHSIGIMINEEKSDLVPSQTANYLGTTIDTRATSIFPPHVRVEKFLSVAETFCTMSAPPTQLWQWSWDTWLRWRDWFLTVDFK